jgi:hypothetical protein
VSSTDAPASKGSTTCTAGRIQLECWTGDWPSAESFPESAIVLTAFEEVTLQHHAKNRSDPARGVNLPAVARSSRGRHSPSSGQFPPAIVHSGVLEVATCTRSGPLSIDANSSPAPPWPREPPPLAVVSSTPSSRGAAFAGEPQGRAGIGDGSRRPAGEDLALPTGFQYRVNSNEGDPMEDGFPTPKAMGSCPIAKLFGVSAFGICSPWVVNEAGTECRDVRSAELDGVAVDPHAILLLGDSAMHEVVVVLGRGDSTALELSSDDAASSADRDSSTD